MVISGHACGVAGGLLSYHLIVAPNSLHIMGGVMQESSFLLGTGAVLTRHSIGLVTGNFYYDCSNRNVS